MRKRPRRSGETAAPAAAVPSAAPAGRRATRRGPAAVELDVLDDMVGYGLRRSLAAVYQDFLRSVGAFEIRPAQYAALVLIGANSGISQIALANTLGLDRSAVVLLVDLLESRELAERRPSGTDRRAHSIVLTESGRQLLARLKRIVGEHDRRITAPLSAAERLQLLDFLRRIYRR